MFLTHSPKRGPVVSECCFHGMSHSTQKRGRGRGPLCYLVRYIERKWARRSPSDIGDKLCLLSTL